MSDVLQITACLFLPLGIFLILLGFGVPFAVGGALLALAVELWFIGRELDIREGDRE